MKSVSIIGVGRIGGAFALGLNEKHYRIENLIARNLTNAKKILDKFEQKPVVCRFNELDTISSEIIFITTQDSEIKGIVSHLSKKSLRENTYIFHTSGSLSSEILNELKEKNCIIGSIHPLVSVSDSFLGVKRFINAYFCLEGELKAVRLAEQIVRELGGKAFSIETKYKSLYHASAVMACGHIVALIDASMELLIKCGLEANMAKEVLKPLIKSTVENVFEQNNSEALTGTFARADLDTLAKHIETIRENSTKDILEIYLNLGDRSLQLAEEQGIEEEKLKKMAEKISLAKNNLKC